MEGLLNFYQSTDSVGTSGQPTREQLEQIASGGYTAVVNLAMHDSDNAIPEEGNIVASLGMSYFHLPVPFEKPEATHLARFIRLMVALDGEKVFVHCAINARVSAFMYKYLTLAKGHDGENCKSPLLHLWLPQMDDAWRRILDLTAGDIGLDKAADSA